MDLDMIKPIILITAITFIFVAAITPFIKSVALHVGAVDVPTKRKVHKRPMPRLGGLGIFLGFLFGYMIFGTPSILMNSILIGSFIIVITGVIDDIRPIKASTKFLGQLAAACIVVFYGDILLQNINAFGVNLYFGIFAYPITIFFILGCINCMNFIDGLDGLAAGISSIYFLTVGIIAIIQGTFGLDYTITFILLGSTLGFLVHNFYPAKIFMGDSGSLFLGFIISVIALLGFKNVTMTTLLLPICLLAIPVMDTLFAIIRRLINKKPIDAPDKEHLHHQLLNLHLSHRNTVLVIYAVDSLFAIAMLVYVLYDNT